MMYNLCIVNRKRECFIAMTQEKDGIFRIKIPFETIYTSSFVLTEGRDAVVYDFGSSDYDSETYIIPELDALGVNVRYLAVSHAHGDHCGGIGAMMKKYPSAKVLHMGRQWSDTEAVDGEVVLGHFKLIALKGHSDDGMAILDTKTNSLVSGDTLQVWGVDRWKTYFTDYELYIETIEKVRALDVDTIIAAHEYEPCGYIAEGKKSVAVYLDECRKAADSKKNNR